MILFSLLLLKGANVDRMMIRSHRTTPLKLKLTIPINPTPTTIPTFSTKPTKTDRNRQKLTRLTSKIDEADKNRRFVRRFRRYFSTRAR